VEAAVAEVLLCPLCAHQVAFASAGCVSCGLPMRDVLRHAVVANPSVRRRAALRARGVRLIGLVAYSAIVAWCAYQLPDAMPFVVSGAVVGGGFLHVWRCRPWLGAVVFAVMVLALPALLAPSVLTDVFSHVTDRS
jgi:hypothetical protein